MLVRWSPPFEHQVALNIDGSSYGNPGRAGYGGLIRDHNGSWIIGFSGPVSFADSVEVELLAIQNGLTLAWNMGFRDVSCRSDCTKALSMIQDSVSHTCKYLHIIKAIEELLCRDWRVSFTHTYRESNQCADFMAKCEANAMLCLGIFEQPPPCLYSLLVSDAMGTPYTRYTKV
ncbi:hypothetical protein RYX36_002193 [Vicia faba]